MTTAPRNGTVIAWTGDQHTVVHRDDVVHDRDKILYVGETYEGDAEDVIDATGDDVDRVIVDGRTIVQNGEVLTLGVPAAVRRLNKMSERVWARLNL